MYWLNMTQTCPSDRISHLELIISSTCIVVLYSDMKNNDNIAYHDGHFVK